MNPLPRRDTALGPACPPDDTGECACGGDLSRGNGPLNCSACEVAICEECADAGVCRHDACVREYCRECVEQFLPAENGGCCANHGNAWRYHADQYEQFFAAAGASRRTG